MQQGENPYNNNNNNKKSRIKKKNPKATDATEFTAEKRTRSQLLKSLWSLRDRCEVANRRLFLSPAGCVRRDARPRPAASEGDRLLLGTHPPCRARTRHTGSYFISDFLSLFLLPLWKFCAPGMMSGRRQVNLVADVTFGKFWGRGGELSAGLRELPGEGGPCPSPPWGAPQPHGRAALTFRGISSHPNAPICPLRYSAPFL